MAVEEQEFVFSPPRRGSAARALLGVFLSVLAIGGAAFGAGALLLPRTLSYEIRDQALIIRSGLALWPKEQEIPLQEIHETRVIRLQPGKRKFGTALPGYCVGRFHFPGPGTVDLYSDCSRDGVVLHAESFKRPLLLTPKNRTAFLAALGGEGIYRENFQPGKNTGTGWRILSIVFCIILLPVLSIPLIFFVSPRKLRYHVGEGILEVHTLLGVRRFTVSNCLARPYRPRSSMKLIGSSIPGYHTGRFRIDGMNTRVYATDLKQGVLIEGPDLRLLVTPEDTEAFLQALQTRARMEIHCEDVTLPV